MYIPIICILIRDLLFLILTALWKNCFKMSFYLSYYIIHLLNPVCFNEVRLLLYLKIQDVCFVGHNSSAVWRLQSPTGSKTTHDLSFVSFLMKKYVCRVCVADIRWTFHWIWAMKCRDTHTKQLQIHLQTAEEHIHDRNVIKTRLMAFKIQMWRKGVQNKRKKEQSRQRYNCKKGQIYKVEFFHTAIWMMVMN